MKQSTAVRSILKAVIHSKTFMIIACKSYCFVHKSQNPQKSDLTMTTVLWLRQCVFSAILIAWEYQSSGPVFQYMYSSKVHFHNSSKVYYTDDLVLWYSGYWEPVLQFYFYPGSKVFIIINLAAFIHLSDEFCHDQTNPWTQSLFENFPISKYVSI